MGSLSAIFEGIIYGNQKLPFLWVCFLNDLEEVTTKLFGWALLDVKGLKGSGFYCGVVQLVWKAFYISYLDGRENSSNHMQVCKGEEVVDKVTISDFRLRVAFLHKD